MILDRLAVPIVLAPLAGGPATPETLAAAVSNAGGLGFLAAGYLSTAALGDQIDRAKALTSAPGRRQPLRPWQLRASGRRG